MQNFQGGGKNFENFSDFLTRDRGIYRTSGNHRTSALPMTDVGAIYRHNFDIVVGPTSVIGKISTSSSDQHRSTAAFHHRTIPVFDRRANEKKGHRHKSLQHKVSSK